MTDPTPDLDQWTKDDDTLLLKLVDDDEQAWTVDSRGWDTIAERVGKSKQSCMLRYIQLGEATHESIQQMESDDDAPQQKSTVTPWTEDENKVLMELVENGYNLTTIAKRIGRSVSSCSAQYHHINKKQLQVAPRLWTDDEDLELKRLVVEGKRWEDISIQLNRSMAASKTRWSNQRSRLMSIEEEGVCYKPWTDDEDKYLIELIEKGEKWRIIAKELKRSIRSCSSRSKRIKPHNSQDDEEVELVQPPQPQLIPPPPQPQQPTQLMQPSYHNVLICIHQMMGQGKPPSEIVQFLHHGRNLAQLECEHKQNVLKMRESILHGMDPLTPILRVDIINKQREYQSWCLGITFIVQLHQLF